MGRRTPNIQVSTTLKKRDRLGFKEFVINVITDTFIYEYQPDLISLDVTNTFFTLTLSDKRFNIDLLEIDNISDYINIYLFGILQPQTRYNVSVTEEDIIITFIENITKDPISVLASDFTIKGKIVDIE
jgi:hypothetical protein